MVTIEEESGMKEVQYKLRSMAIDGKVLDFKDAKVQVKGNEWRVQVEETFLPVVVENSMKENRCVIFQGQDADWTYMDGTGVIVEVTRSIENHDKFLLVGVGKLGFKRQSKKKYSERLTSIEESLDQLRVACESPANLKPLFFSEIEWLISRAKKCEELERNGA
jgi:hypothetical protein